MAVIEFQNAFWRNAKLNSFKFASVNEVNLHLAACGATNYSPSLTPYLKNKTGLFKLNGSVQGALVNNAAYNMSTAYNSAMAVGGVGNGGNNAMSRLDLYEPIDPVIYFEYTTLGSRFNATSSAIFPAYYLNINNYPSLPNYNRGKFNAAVKGTFDGTTWSAVDELNFDDYSNWLALTNIRVYARDNPESDRIDQGANVQLGFGYNLGQLRMARYNTASGNVSTTDYVSGYITSRYLYGAIANVLTQTAEQQLLQAYLGGTIITSQSQLNYPLPNVGLIHDDLQVRDINDFYPSRMRTVNITDRNNANRPIYNAPIQRYNDTERLFTAGEVLSGSATCYNTYWGRTVLLFKDVQAIIDFFADWGLLATDNKDDAATLPDDFFPSTGGFVPDGGSADGYEENPTPNIGGIPDNTSDVIERTTTQITAMSAINTMALDVIGVKSLFNWLITDDFTKNISNLFNDKLSALNSLKLYPFDIVRHDTSSTFFRDTLSVANVSTSIANYAIYDGYNCYVFGGSINQLPYYGNFNDYVNTRYSLYIPYAGIVELSPNVVLNADLELYYAVDLLSGNATAIIYSNKVLIKTIPAQMGAEIPITYSNANQQQINNALTALNIGSSLVGGIGAAAAGNPIPLASAAFGGLMTATKTAMTNPLVMGHTGGISSNTSLILPQTPFLIIDRARIAVPKDYGKIAGYSSNYGGSLSEFSGGDFVQFRADKISIAGATDGEKTEIYNALLSGVYI